MKSKTTPLLVAIVGGSGAGKSWLADHLQALLGEKAARLSLDDFYRDRSHLPVGRRTGINYDHPRAIDWERMEQTLGDCLAGRITQIPQYDFATHSRRSTEKILRPKPLILVDGLWLLRRPAMRRLFHLSIFIDCPPQTRLNRRMARDLLSRRRSRASVERQFRETVEPMNALHVVPQARWAEMRLQAPIKQAEVRRLAGELIAKMRIIIHDAKI